MAPPLAVRNLTSTSITIRCVEQFEDPNTLQSSSSGYFFSSKATSPAVPTSPQLGEHAQSFNHQDLDIELRPFESYTLNPSKPDRGQDHATLSNTTVRLTIETRNGERHRIDSHPSYTQKSTQAFTPLLSNPSTSYTALFHPSKSIPHLAIHTNHLFNYQEWMSALPDELPLSAISIPGTHNSHTYYRALPSVRCQAVDVKAQLENGIRFLDIRVQPVNATDTSKKDMYLVHGAFPISLTGPKYLEPILKSCYEFLITHPSETVLVSLKREGIGSSTDEHLGHLLEKHYISPNASKWHTGSTIPYLGDVRGKLVLVRRYNTENKDKTFGLDATAWPYNVTHALFPQHSATFCLQDFCEVLVPEAIDKKVQYSNEHLIRAAECTHHIPGVNTDTTNPVPPGALYLNFLSGSNFWKRACWPEQISKIVNKGMEEWLCAGHHLDHPDASPRHPDESSTNGNTGAKSGTVRTAKSGDGGTGVVVMDYVGDNGDWELVRLIVGMNMGVLMKVQEQR